MQKNNYIVKEYGYQSTNVENRGYQPINPGNGYQPTTSGPPTQSPPTPPSGGSSSQDK